MGVLWAVGQRSKCLIAVRRSAADVRCKSQGGRVSTAKGAGRRPRGPGVVRTKLHPPAVPTQAIQRGRLLERLRSRGDERLTLLAAPAGSGKTTLLAAWREAESAVRPVAWVSLDEGDGDPVVLWSHVLEALRQVSPSFDVPRAPAEVGSSRLVDTVLKDLVNEVERHGDLALVLDDFHRVADGPGRDSVVWFVDHAPRSLQLIVAARSDPGLHVPALRAHGDLIEVRATDLGFTVDEADEFLNGRLEL